MTGYVILAFLLGFGFGYLVYYFRYEHKDAVNELRGNLKEATKELNRMHSDLEEYGQQNIILKEKTSELLDKNEDLTQVISELSKYYYHLKKASEKTKELVKYLSSPDESIEEKMQKYALEAGSKTMRDEEKEFF